MIAEAGVNHDGDEVKARRLVHAARAAGADAVKFQVFEPDLLVTPTASTARYQARATGSRLQREMLARLALPRPAFRRLAAEARRAGIDFLATPFDPDSLEFVASLDVPAMKIGSGDLNNPFLLEGARRTGLPVLLSTGMATLDEIAVAFRYLHSVPGLCLLHCVSLYPCPLARANVLGVRTLAERFARPVGYSDHTLGNTAAIGAVALGACVIEKHLTLDARAPGPDHAASLEPAAFRELATRIHEMSAALGDGKRVPSAEELAVARVARRSLAVRHDLPAGARLVRGDLVALRPASGIPPREYPRVVGRRARRALHAGTLLCWSLLEE